MLQRSEELASEAGAHLTGTLILWLRDDPTVLVELALTSRAGRRELAPSSRRSGASHASRLDTVTWSGCHGCARKEACRCSEHVTGEASG